DAKDFPPAQIGCGSCRRSYLIGCRRAPGSKPKTKVYHALPFTQLVAKSLYCVCRRVSRSQRRAGLLDCGLDDSFAPWHGITSLHLWLFMQRLRAICEQTVSNGFATARPNVDAESLNLLVRYVRANYRHLSTVPNSDLVDNGIATFLPLGAKPSRDETKAWMRQRLKHALAPQSTVQRAGQQQGACLIIITRKICLSNAMATAGLLLQRFPSNNSNSGSGSIVTDSGGGKSRGLVLIHDICGLDIGQTRQFADDLAAKAEATVAVMPDHVPRGEAWSLGQIPPPDKPNSRNWLSTTANADKGREGNPDQTKLLEELRDQPFYSRCVHRRYGRRLARILCRPRRPQRRQADGRKSWTLATRWPSFLLTTPEAACRASAAAVFGATATCAQLAVLRSASFGSIAPTEADCLLASTALQQYTANSSISIRPTTVKPPPQRQGSADGACQILEAGRVRQHANRLLLLAVRFQQAVQLAQPGEPAVQHCTSGCGNSHGFEPQLLEAAPSSWRSMQVSRLWFGASSPASHCQLPRLSQLGQVTVLSQLLVLTALAAAVLGEALLQSEAVAGVRVTPERRRGGLADPKVDELRVSSVALTEWRLQQLMFLCRLHSVCSRSARPPIVQEGQHVQALHLGSQSAVEGDPVALEVAAVPHGGHLSLRAAEYPALGVAEVAELLHQQLPAVEAQVVAEIRWQVGEVARHRGHVTAELVGEVELLVPAVQQLRPGVRRQAEVRVQLAELELAQLPQRDRLQIAQGHVREGQAGAV
uniref:DDE_Tnp_ISL3 domain-containing protein n=1 Tax=Macrostomum lignano TaxID=282301 RepID=A0A1I8F434_9PLAT